MNTNSKYTPTSAKYKNARFSLLLVVIFSAVNLIMLFSDSYILFSARIPLVIASVGIALREQALQDIYLVIALIISILCIFPYFLCWLFSKKRVGWMIAALILFSVDTIFLLIDAPTFLAFGDFSIFIDIIAHGIIIFELAVGVKAGNALKREEMMAYSENITEDVTEDTNFQPTQLREIIITRQKSFVGCAIALVIYVNGREVCTLKNGQTEKFQAPITAFELSASLNNGFAANSIVVESGVANLYYDIKIKSGFTSTKIEIIKK